MTKKIFGSLVTVTIPSIGIPPVVAKVDTGAWSGVLHCTDIRVIDNMLHFTPLGDEQFKASTNLYEYRLVRSASGHAEQRYLIPVTLAIEGKKYDTTLGLSDRGEMQREMLLGRKFLIENNILIDVGLTLDEDTEAEKYL